MSRLLKEGRSGEDVKELQDFLIKYGYLEGSADGDFGPKTKAAVIKFQKEKGLSPDGEAGPKTWAEIDKIRESEEGNDKSEDKDDKGEDKTPRRLVKEGRSGEDVKELQEFLVKNGYLKGNVDGKFGPNTKAAVIKFQKEKGLTPDGECGPTTWAEIDKVLSV